MAFNVIMTDNNTKLLSGRMHAVMERVNEKSQRGFFKEYLNSLNIRIKPGSTNTIEINTGMGKEQGVLFENDSIINVTPTPSSSTKSCRLVFSINLSTKLVTPRVIYDTTSPLPNQNDLTTGSISTTRDIVVATFTLGNAGIGNLFVEMPTLSFENEVIYQSSPGLTLGSQNSTINNLRFYKEIEIEVRATGNSTYQIPTQTTMLLTYSKGMNHFYGTLPGNDGNNNTRLSIIRLNTNGNDLINLVMGTQKYATINTAGNVGQLDGIRITKITGTRLR